MASSHQRGAAGVPPGKSYELIQITFSHPFVSNLRLLADILVGVIPRVGHNVFQGLWKHEGFRELSADIRNLLETLLKCLQMPCNFRKALIS